MLSCSVSVRASASCRKRWARGRAIAQQAGDIRIDVVAAPPVELLELRIDVAGSLGRCRHHLHHTPTTPAHPLHHKRYRQLSGLVDVYLRIAKVNVHSAAGAALLAQPR